MTISASDDKWQLTTLLGHGSQSLGDNNALMVFKPEPKIHIHHAYSDFWVSFKISKGKQRYITLITSYHLLSTLSTMNLLINQLIDHHYRRFSSAAPVFDPWPVTTTACAELRSSDWCRRSNSPRPGSSCGGGAAKGLVQKRGVYLWGPKHGDIRCKSENKKIWEHIRLSEFKRMSPVEWNCKDTGVDGVCGLGPLCENQEL